jgi:ATP-binding cassette subfamily C protein
MIHQAVKIFAVINRRTKRGLIGLFALMVVSALLEMAGIGLFLPLLQLLSNSDSIFRVPFLGQLHEIMGDDDRGRFIVIFCFSIFAFFVFKSIALAAVIFIQNRFVTYHRAIFTESLLRHYLEQPYVFHLQRNTMEMIRNVTLLGNRLFSKGLLPLLQITMELLVIMGISIVLILVDPLSTILMGLALGGVATIFYMAIRHKIRVWGRHILQYDGDILLWINQALGSIKETKLYHHEDFFCRAFAQPNMDRATYLARTITAPQLPRLFIEAAAIGAMALLVAVLVSISGSTIEDVVPTLGLFAVAAMRLMPSLSKIVGAVTTFRENTATVDVIHADVINVSEAETAGVAPKQETRDRVPFSFKKELRLESVSYHYPETSELVLNDIELTISRGQSVALVGPSGAGKTTLVDLVLGLLDPVEGCLYVDGRNIHDDMDGWQALIGYIPQDIYITDDTLRRNIALGNEDEDIDETRLGLALSLAQLDSVTDGMSEGLDTIIGERGARLSGGQRQRVGIARALYHDPELLVMDEATSSLDTETEKEIAAAINQLSGEKTLIIIAHRFSTIRHCDLIVLLDGGRISESGSFDNLVERNAGFRRMVEMTNLNPGHILEPS